MDDEQEQAIHEAVNVALNELAERLGGTTETGGPVVNANQIKGRGDLGVLLTDIQERVLGRVWIAFGAAVSTPSALSGTGDVQVQAEVCSEIVDPPQPITEWVEGR
jgi:hypothetical protein